MKSDLNSLFGTNTIYGTKVRLMRIFSLHIILIFLPIFFVYSENESELIEQIKNNQKDQLAAGHHGVPLSVYKNSYFFGQDRFDDLINELKKDGLNYP